MPQPNGPILQLVKLKTFHTFNKKAFRKKKTKKQKKQNKTTWASKGKIIGKRQFHIIEIDVMTCYNEDLLKVPHL